MPNSAACPAHCRKGTDTNAMTIECNNIADKSYEIKSNIVDWKKVIIYTFFAHLDLKKVIFVSCIIDTIELAN